MDTSKYAMNESRAYGLAVDDEVVVEEEDEEEEEEEEEDEEDDEDDEDDDSLLSAREINFVNGSELPYDLKGKLRSLRSARSERKTSSEL